VSRSCQVAGWSVADEGHWQVTTGHTPWWPPRNSDFLWILLRFRRYVECEQSESRMTNEGWFGKGFWGGVVAYMTYFPGVCLPQKVVDALVEIRRQYFSRSYRWITKIHYKQTTNSVALSPQTNYTDWATATCRRNLVPTLADKAVSRGQCGGSPTVVNLSFLDRSRYLPFK
jgi:hypothetical protein